MLYDVNVRIRGKAISVTATKGSENNPATNMENRPGGPDNEFSCYLHVADESKDRNDFETIWIYASASYP